MKTWKIILIVVSTAMLIAPLTAYATVSMFADVPDNHIFVEDINWMKTAGVTNGCGDGTNYCPNDNVTRGQMAAFMHRLATNRVVDADKLDGKDSNDFLMDTTWVHNTATYPIIPAGNQVFREVQCPINKSVISGGGQSSYEHLVMTISRPLNDVKWRVAWTNTGDTTINPTLTVWAMCAGRDIQIAPLP